MVYKIWHHRWQIRQSAILGKLRELHPKGSLRLLSAGQEKGRFSGRAIKNAIAARNMACFLADYKRMMPSRFTAEGHRAILT